MHKYTNEFSKTLAPFLQKIKTTEYPEEHRNHTIHNFLKENDVKIDSTGSQICRFLKGKSIFITGSTGFLGKLLVEKLLRACIEIDSLFLLVREKKSKDQNARLSELLDDVVFEKLSSIHPNYKSKIFVIHGDIELPGLGIADIERKKLTERVNVVFHLAATTRFDAHITSAVAININGTKEVIKLAKECKNLVSFVHVSTAYSNCDNYHIEEKIYEPHIRADELISMADCLSRDVLEEITPKLLGKFPNTYTLTKHIAEAIIKTEAQNLPVCIHRPSIVISTSREPIRSWVDNIYGPAGLMAGVCVGVVRIMPGSINNRCDLVPADYVINSCIASSYRTAEKKNPNDIPVYNFTTEKENIIKWDYLNSDYFYKLGMHTGSNKLIRYGDLYMVKNPMLCFIFKILYEKMFAYMIDGFLYVTGKEPRLVKAYKRIDKFKKLMSFFTLHEFDFETKNTNDLWDSLNNQDKKAFPFSMKHIHWKSYLLTFLVGIRLYLFKENLDTLEEGRAHIRRLYWIHITSNTIIFGGILLLWWTLLNFFFF